MFCTKCGSPNDDDWVYCCECGIPLKKTEPEASSAPETKRSDSDPSNQSSVHLESKGSVSSAGIATVGSSNRESG